MKRLRRAVMIALSTLLAAYAALAGLIFFAQRGMIFPVPPGAREPSLPGGALLRIPTPAGTVFAFHVPAPPGAPTVVHFHGNGEQLGDSAYLAERFRAQGLGFFSVEYPGYGLARGAEPSESGLYAAAQAALEYLHGALGTPPERIVLFGQSLGTGVATEMAARGHGARLALVSPYTSIADMGARLLPWLPARLLVRDRFDTASKAPRLTLPVLLVHGIDDEVIPVDMSRQLARIFPRVELRLLEGAHHNDVLQVRGGAGLEALIAFARAQ